MRIAYLSLVSLLLIGCASSNETAEDTTIEQTKIEPVIVKEQYPSWVLNPIVPGYLAVVGAAPKQNDNNEKWQLLAAELNAQAELAKQVDLYIEHQTVVAQETTNGKLESEVVSESKQTSIQALDLSQAEIIKRWVSKDGTLYILYVVALQD